VISVKEDIKMISAVLFKRIEVVLIIWFGNVISAGRIAE
jgi:hypothetical protein